MTKNLGTIGRLVRLLIAISLFVASWWYHSFTAFAFGLFVLYEAIAGWCALLHFLRSCKK
jgi:hypothetical protein